MVMIMMMMKMIMIIINYDDVIDDDDDDDDMMQDGQSALYNAVWHKQFVIVDYLLDHNVDIHSRTNVSI